PTRFPPIPMGTDIRASHRKSSTSDYSFSLKWLASDRTEISTDLQYIKATTRALDSTVALGLNIPWIDVDLGGGVPRIGVDTAFTADPANYYWAFTMDHRDDNEAEEVAWRADLRHSFQSGLVEAVKFGVRVTDRDADSIDNGYDWQPVIQPWMQWWALSGEEPLPGLDLGPGAGSDMVNLATFQNFYRGDANTPGAFYAPQLATALGFPGSYEAIHAAADPYYLCCYAGVYAPRDLADPQWGNVQRERTYAAYAMLEFAFEQAPVTGNVGVRVVRTENSADGFLIYPNQAYAPYLGAGESEPIGARNSYTDVLPSANLKWEPAQDLVVRFAASRAVARPAFSDMQAVQLLSVEPREGVTAPDDGSTLPLEDLQLTDTSTDNPYLTPMRANQFDLSLEWYFAPDRGGMAWVNLFHKSVKDYFRQQTRLEPHPGADGNQYNYLASRMVNVGTATVRGAELGWNQFFDFLPTPFDGLGMSVNYTYIDSSTSIPDGSNALPIDTDGTRLGDLPADGLSKNSYNAAVFYEKGPWQVRLAYNWRSQYLLSVGPNGYN